MAVCYFNQNYDKRFNCEYLVKENSIEVSVEYDIHTEIKPNPNGIIIRGNTKYNTRDIIIIDFENKKNYLLKESYYMGNSNKYGTPDDAPKTKFQANIYFISNDYNKLCELPQTPKANKIKIYSKDIVTLLGSPSLLTVKNDDEYILKFKNESQKRNIIINNNNIKSISVGDNWSSVHDSKKHSIHIELSGYIELELTRRVNYDVISDFVHELICFMQLYHPDKFTISKISVFVDKKTYDIVFPISKLEYKEQDVDITINNDLLEHLSKCYNLIPYRNSKTQIRNIPYIVLNNSRGLEDSFLMFYRFIECYYKNQRIPDIKKAFISYSIKNNYINYEQLSLDKIEQYSQEIVCLRNHYVHAGYYIKNSCLKISFDRINRKKNPKDYTANNVDIDWIYEKTQILYKIVIDIIFSNMLGYENYKFDRHF